MVVGSSQFARFWTAGSAPAEIWGALAIRPVSGGRFKLGTRRADAPYKLHNSSAAASVPSPQQLASGQGHEGNT